MLDHADCTAPARKHDPNNGDQQSIYPEDLGHRVGIGDLLDAWHTSALWYAGKDSSGSITLSMYEVFLHHGAGSN